MNFLSEEFALPGLALWDTHDRLDMLQAMDGFTCERHTVFFGNFQVVVVTKNKSE